MQALDEEYLKVDAQFGGVDQRKIFMYAEKVSSQSIFKSIRGPCNSMDNICFFLVVYFHRFNVSSTKYYKETIYSNSSFAFGCCQTWWIVHMNVSSFQSIYTIQLIQRLKDSKIFWHKNACLTLKQIHKTMCLSKGSTLW